MQPERIGQRLRELRLEFDKGRREIEQLDGRRRELEATMLRIEGAMQVLTELSDDTQPTRNEGPHSAAGA